MKGYIYILVRKTMCRAIIWHTGMKYIPSEALYLKDCPILCGHFSTQPTVFQVSSHGSQLSSLRIKGKKEIMVKRFYQKPFWKTFLDSEKLPYKYSARTFTKHALLTPKPACIYFMPVCRHIYFMPVC